MKEIIKKLKSLRLFLAAHPDNTLHSEMYDRYCDVVDIMEQLNMLLKWRKVDPDNLPDGEVLARGLEYQLVIGELFIDQDKNKGMVKGESIEGWILPTVTHYIPLSELFNLETE